MENAVSQAEQGEQPIIESQEQARKPQPPRNVHAARIVVVGGGVAGLEVATALGKLKSESIDTVTLVDSDSAHVLEAHAARVAAGTRDLAQQQTLISPRPPMPTLPTSRRDVRPGP
jgi:NADH dehydrogenase